MSHTNYVFVERLFLLLVQLVVKNITSSFDYWKCDLGTCGFGLSQKLKSRAARIWMSAQMSMICSQHWVVGKSLITKYMYHVITIIMGVFLRSLDLCLVTTSLLIDWFLYQLFNEKFPFYTGDELWNSFAAVLNDFTHGILENLGLLCVQ